MANNVQGGPRRNSDVSGGESSVEQEETTGSASSDASRSGKPGSVSINSKPTPCLERASSWRSSEEEAQPRLRSVGKASTRAAFNRAFNSASTTAATAGTTTTTAASSASTSFPALTKSQDGKPPATARHTMPTLVAQGGRRDTPPSPTRLTLGGDKPKAPTSSTSSAPSSPRRSSAGSSARPAQTPRPKLLAPGTPRASTVNAVDRNIEAALTAAGSIRSKKSKQARLEAFQSVLSQAAAIAPAARGDVVLALAKSLYSLSEDGKGACLMELRELAADMPPDFRKAFVQKLLKQLISNRDGCSGESSGEGLVSDAKQFKEQYASREACCSAVGKLLAQDVTEESLQKIARLIQKTGFSESDRGVLGTVIMEIDHIDPHAQKQVVDLFANAGLTCADVLGALMQSPHMAEIGGLAKKTGLSISALYLGALTGDRVVIEKLLRILSCVSLPLAVHIYLAEKFGKLRRSAPVAPTAAMASCAVLLEIISMSRMPEAHRCLLMHSVSAASSDAVYKVLNDSDLNDERDFWAHAHQVIATVIDIGTCYALVKDNDDEDDLASYAMRAKSLMKDAAAKAIANEGKCIWDAPGLRTLILEGSDRKKLKNAVFNVLNSKLSHKEKLALVKGETKPIGDSVNAHVREIRYKAAVEQYKKKNRGEIGTGLAYNVVVDSQEKYDAAYKKLTANLDPDALGEIRLAATRAMVAAKRSRLPALHVAATSAKADIVAAYIETVLGFVDVIPEPEIVGFLELSSNGASLFHYAMVEGAANVIERCMPLILDAELTLANKIVLLEARRKPDRIGAFYLAMSCGQKETATGFVQGVLKSTELDDETKLGLLQCVKPAPDRKIGSSAQAHKMLSQAAMTARAEAERMKHHRLVGDFDSKVERSGLGRETKDTLQTN
jgi:hypothetical protein